MFMFYIYKINLGKLFVIIKNINTNMNMQINPSAKTCHYLPKTNLSCDTFQKQPNFCSLGETSHLINQSGISVLSKYFEKFNKFNLNSSTFLWRETPGDAQILILDKPQKFADAIDTFTKNINMYNIRNNLNYDVLDAKMQQQKDIIKNIPGFANTQIIGLMGKGGFNTVYLTKENDILKLSLFPNTPHPEDFVPGLELPINESFAIQNKGHKLFVIREPLTENSELRNITTEQYVTIWKNFHKKLKDFNSKFKFQFDFRKNEISGKEHVGFIGENPYLIDRGTIDYRRYVDIEDAKALSQINLRNYPVHFING
jgi:hypothetical protein